jgi:hypothetical protein
MPSRFTLGKRLAARRMWRYSSGTEPWLMLGASQGHRAALLYLGFWLLGACALS